VIKAGATAGPYETLAKAQEAGAVTVNYGVFVDTLISFILVAFAVFILVKNVNKLKRQEAAPAPAAPTTKECPYCLSTIPIKATRCGHCTSTLTA
jgi:large conductance mechanosensitive channel